MGGVMYECALSGLTEEAGYADASDGLADLPLGWTRITITRRQLNPKWVAIQRVKETLTRLSIDSAKVPPEHQDTQAAVIGLQVEAQFHSLEKDTPMYLPDLEETVYLSDSVDVIEGFNDLRGILGLPPILHEGVAGEGDESTGDGP